MTGPSSFTHSLASSRKAHSGAYGRPWRRRLVGLSFVAVVMLALVELVIRVPMVALPNPLATYLYSCYERVNPSRYAFAPLARLDLWFHRPGFVGRCYFNAHHWNHKSDAFGWRNPKTWRRATVALIGDSMIYGHGVDEADTVAHRLRDRSGARVANLGITAGFPGEYLAVMRNFAVRLHPKVIAVYFFANDLTDLRAFRSQDQIRAFAETGAAAEAAVVGRQALLADVPPPPAAPPLDWLYLARAVRFFALPRRERTGSLAQGLPSDLSFPDHGAPLGFDCGAFERRFEVELRYVDRAIAEMHDTAMQRGSQLVVGYLPEPARSATDVCFARALRRFAAHAGIPLARPRLHDAAGGPLPGTRLVGDGHLTGAGAEIVAGNLVDVLRRWFTRHPRGGGSVVGTS